MPFRSVCHELLLHRELALDALAAQLGLLDLCTRGARGGVLLDAPDKVCPRRNPSTEQRRSERTGCGITLVLQADHALTPRRARALAGLDVDQSVREGTEITGICGKIRFGRAASCLVTLASGLAHGRTPRPKLRLSLREIAICTSPGSGSSPVEEQSGRRTGRSHSPGRHDRASYDERDREEQRR